MGRTNWSTLTRQQRGYGRDWELKRARVLERDSHLCQCLHCKASGRVAVATEVDHIVSRAKAQALGWTEEQAEDEANLQAINTDCHKRKTQEERGKHFRSKVRIGLDGWPVKRPSEPGGE
jgi:5-methylcytosine-specific restriction protein A